MSCISLVEPAGEVENKLLASEYVSLSDRALVCKQLSQLQTRQEYQQVCLYSVTLVADSTDQWRFCCRRDKGFTLNRCKAFLHLNTSFVHT